jgi:tetratricopeptide (TPR) repeat protein
MLLLVVLVLGGCAQGTQLKPNAQTFDIPSLEKRAKAAPGDGDLQFRLASEYEKSHQYREAIEAYKKSYGGSSPIPESAAWHAMAGCHSALGQFDAAITAQKRYVELRPDVADGYVRLADFYFRDKQYDETIATAKQALSVQSTNGAAYTYLGVGLGGKRQYAEAIKALQRASELSPGNPNNYMWMGRYYKEQGAFIESAAMYRKAVEVAPQNAGANHEVSMAYYWMGRYDDAISWSDKAIDLATIKGGLGLGFQVRNGYPVVTEVFDNSPAKTAGVEAGDKISEIDGNQTSGWTLETFAQHAMGAAGTQALLNIERAGANLRKTVTRGTVITKDAAVYIACRSSANRYKGDPDKACEDAALAASVNPSHDSVVFALGSCYFDRGQYEKAAATLAQVKNSGVVRLVEATALAKQAKTTDAVEMYAAIPQAEIQPHRVPVAYDRRAFFLALKPFVKEHREKARLLESQGQYRESLTELAEALKAADDAEAQEILSACFAIARKSPAMGQIPDGARKYAIRSELLVKESNFAEATAELDKAIRAAPYVSQLYYNAALNYAELKQFSEAIRQMKFYLASGPEPARAQAANDEIIKWEFMIEKGKGK